MYVEWYGVCDFGQFSVVEICVDYGFMCVLFVVYGDRVCVNLWGVACVVECCLFFSVWVMFVVLWCSVVSECVCVGGGGGCDFVLSVMRVVGGVLLRIVWMFRRVDVVCWCLLYTQLIFWVRWFVLYVLVCWL